jgi:ParB/RepB/Spo0J family partition protein
VRRTKAGVSIEDLAEDIARRGLLQSLNVQPVLDADGAETGVFEIPAGGRRYRALERLVSQKRLSKTALIPCIVRDPSVEVSAEEDSLAENLQRAALHPLDQFRAFKTLREKGAGDEEIAARFFVAPAVVKQRLRLAAVSEKLLGIYAEDGMTLEQLMAFTVTNDHARQEQVAFGVGVVSGVIMPFQFGTNCLRGRAVFHDMIVSRRILFIARYSAISSDYRSSPRTNEGDGHKMALAAGAALARMDQANIMVQPPVIYDGHLHGLPLRIHAEPDSIILDGAGRRFASEYEFAMGERLMDLDPATGKPKHMPDWIISHWPMVRRTPLIRWYRRYDKNLANDGEDAARTGL